MNKSNKKKSLILIILLSFVLLTFNFNAYSAEANYSYGNNLTEIWNYQEDKGGYIQEIRYDTNGRMFLSNTGDYLLFIVSLDTNGKLIWDYYLKDRTFNDYYITKKYIYLTNTFNNQLVLLDKATGRKVKEITLDVNEDDYVMDIIVDYDENIYVTTAESFAIYEKDGTMDWGINIDIPFDFKLVIGPNGNIYILGALDDKNYRLYAIKSSGSIAWSKDLTFEGYRFTSQYNDYPIMFDNDGNLYIKDEFAIYSLDSNNGRINWNYKFKEFEREGFNFLLEEDGNFYEEVNVNRSKNLVDMIDDTIVIYSKYEMIALDAKDGEEVWYFDRGRFPIKGISEVNDTIYAVYDWLYAFDEDGEIIFKYDIDSQNYNSNIEIQVDNYNNIYLLEYNYGSPTGSLYLLNNLEDKQLITNYLPIDRHRWYMTGNGPIYTAQNYVNGVYRSQLYSIKYDQITDQIQVDGIVIDIIEKYGFIDVVTSNKLYNYTYLYYYDPVDGSELENNSDSNYYIYVDSSVKNNSYGYYLDENWRYNVLSENDAELSLDDNSNIYLSMIDRNFLTYLYSFGTNGILNWAKNFTGDDLRTYSVSDDYIHVYDLSNDYNRFILLDRKSGTQRRDFTINTADEEINDIIVDEDSNLYISTENRIEKYNKYGYRQWNKSMSIPTSTKTVMGEDGIIYVFRHYNNDVYKLYAINANGNTKWTTNLTLEDYSLDDNDFPILFDQDGTIYVLNDDDNTLYLINPADGDIIFKHVGDESFNLLLEKDQNPDLSKNRSDKLVKKINNKIVLYTSNKVYALDNLGRTYWNFEYTRNIRDIGTQGDFIYVLFDDVLYALNKDGYQIWNYQIEINDYYNKKLFINDYGAIYVTEYKYGNNQGLIHALNESGKLQWKYINSTRTEQRWYLTTKAPIYTTYEMSTNTSQINLLNKNGLNSFKVNGRVLDIIDNNDNTLYILTDEKIYSYNLLYGITNPTY